MLCIDGVSFGSDTTGFGDQGKRPGQLSLGTDHDGNVDRTTILIDNNHVPK